MFKPKCTDANVFGEFFANGEFAGKQLADDAFKGISVKNKLGYAGSSSIRHRVGVAENPSTAIKEQIQKFKDMGLKQKPAAGHFRDPLVLFGEERVRPIIDAAAQWKQTVLNQGLSKTEGRTLWNKEVKPIVEEQRKLHFQENPTNYYEFMANRYYDRMAEGVEVFGGESNILHDSARKAAGYYTGLSPHIAFYDVLELITKGLTRYGPINFTKGMANLLVETKGVGAFGRLEQNKSLYFGTNFSGPEPGKVKAGAQWLAEHIDPQYYSNNLLVNGSAAIGRAAGVNPAEAVRKIGFIKEIGNAPEYLAGSDASITWARYSFEAAKFYLDIHADLGRAMLAKDAKAFTAAAGQVLTYHGLLTTIAGVGASLPPGVGKLANAIAGVDDEDSVLKAADEALPFANVMGKASGLNMKRGLQVAAPAFGLAWSAGNGLVSKASKDIPEAVEALRNDDPYLATGLMLEAVQSGLAVRYRNPFLTKTAKNWFITGAEFQRGETPDDAFSMLTGLK